MSEMVNLADHFPDLPARIKDSEGRPIYVNPRLWSELKSYFVDKDVNYGEVGCFVDESLTPKQEERRFLRECTNHAEYKDFDLEHGLTKLLKKVLRGGEIFLPLNVSSLRIGAINEGTHWLVD